MILEVALWTSLIVRGDGTYDMHEGIKSEQSCREAMCYAQYGINCADHEIKVKEDKIRAVQADIDRKLAELEYRQNHPCTVNKDGSRICPTSICSADTYDKDGKQTGWSMDGQCFGGISSIGPIGTFVDRSIKVAVCFSAKPDGGK